MIPWILGSAVLSEAVALTFGIAYNRPPFGIYHFHIPLDYVLQGIFFTRICQDKIFTRLVRISMPLFVIGSLVNAFIITSLETFPGLIMNAESVLLILMSGYVLLTLDPVQGLPIYRLPMFWICIGYIVFCGGTFFFHGLYNYMLAVGHPLTRFAQRLINNGLNIFMYVCIIIGLLYSHKLYKSMNR
jgi:hypothetical protein